MRIGPYVVEREIGRGGMGVVYLARDSRLMRPVAVKTLPPDMADDRARLARFRREALLLASLNHPNIAQIHDLEEHDGRQNLILEYVPGESLAQRLDRGSLAVDVALRLAAQIARAIEAAHGHGVIHRDLKPGNIRITAANVAKVVDFGLAKSVGPAGPQRNDEPDRAQLVGTPAYMSPEQTRGDAVDRATDLWAFACVLYECLAGRACFDGPTITTTLESVRRDAPNWSRLPTDTPPAIRRLLERCLMKDEKARFADAGRAAEIIEDVLAGSSDQWIGAPPVPSAGNLPVPAGGFVGRSRELERIVTTLGSAALVTLTGPGGCGKTRLAMEVATRVRDGFPDGAWFVALEGLSDPALVPAAVAAAVGVDEKPGASLSDSVTRHFEDRTALVVLDNCEHLLDACATLAHDLTRRCPRLKILATSRGRLGLVGERALLVPPLATPEDDDDVSFDAIAGTESVRLFVERARGAMPHFGLDDANASAVARICRRLDGMPLAIELAAARLRVLAPDQILARLDQRFRLLHAEGPSHPDRHRTLDAAIDWSVRLLDETERSLLAALSIFAGSWTLESAAVVCGPDLDEFDLLDRLEQLVDKSLVVAHDESVGAVRRYGLLETMRAYARRLLPADRVTDLQRRHLDHFVAVAEASEARVQGRDQRASLERLDADHRNLLAALDHAVSSTDRGRRAAGLRIAAALARFWLRRGHFAIGIRSLSTALAAAGDRAAPAVRAKALDGSGALAWRLGNYDEARSSHELARSIWGDLGDERGLASSLNGLGNLAYVQREYDEARRLHVEALAIRRRIGDPSAVAGSLTNLGNVAYEQGDYASARRLHEESLENARRRDDPWGVATSLNNLGNIAFDLGDLDTARRLHEESLQIKREIGDRWGIGASLTNLGHVALEAGHLPVARRMYRKALVTWRRLGDAAEYAECLEAVSCLAVATGEPGRGGRLLGAAERLRESIGSPIPANARGRHERCAAQVASALGDAGLQHELSGGRGLRAVDAVAEAIAWLDADADATRSEGMDDVLMTPRT